MVYGLFSSCHHKETETETDDLFIYEVISNSKSDKNNNISLIINKIWRKQNYSIQYLKK